MTFVYDDYFTTHESTLVQGVYYNVRDQELLVCLKDEDGDLTSAYVYPEVVRADFDSFCYATSKGGYYNRVIKAEYGPGEPFDLDVESILDREALPAATDVTTAEVTPLPTLVNLFRENLADEDPEGPDYLPTPDPERTTYNHVVHFTVNGGNNVQTHTVEAGSNVFEGVEEVQAAADMLGVDIVVKGVYVQVG